MLSPRYELLHRQPATRWASRIFADVRFVETLYGGFGWHRVDVVAEFGQQVITNYHIVSVHDLRLAFTAGG